MRCLYCLSVSLSCLSVCVFQRITHEVAESATDLDEIFWIDGLQAAYID